MSQYSGLVHLYIWHANHERVQLPSFTILLQGREVSASTILASQLYRRRLPILRTRRQQMQCEVCTPRSPRLYGLPPRTDWYAASAILVRYSADACAGSASSSENAAQPVSSFLRNREPQAAALGDLNTTSPSETRSSATRCSCEGAGISTIVSVHVSAAVNIR